MVVYAPSFPLSGAGRFAAAWWTSEAAFWRSSITAGGSTADSTLMVGQGVKKAPLASGVGPDTRDSLI